jgi:hypothetical protein
MSVAVSRESARLRFTLSLTDSAVRAVIPISLTASSAVIWADSLQGIDLRLMTGVGLVSVLPTQTYVAMALSIAGFMITLYQSRILVPLLLLQLATWIVMLHGINALVVAEPVFSVAWRHAGISDYIIRNRGLDANLDAYFSWPGFFGLSALITKIAALSSPVALIRWAPPFFNLLYLAPLVVIFKSATSDQRALWLGLWLFYTTNWISQDYFSPQALAYFAYLLVLGILLKWFGSEEGRPFSKRERFLGMPRKLPLRNPARNLEEGKGREAPESGGGSERLVAATVLILVFAATVPSHQLTPFALLLGVALLVITRQVTLRGLPTLMAVLVGTWISYMTVTFLAGHLGLVFDPLGLKESAVVNVQGRLQGSQEHLLVVYARLAMTALVWALAALGAIRAKRSFRSYFSYLILMVAPFPLLLLQPYGGEMLLRIYLLILPFCALFIGCFLAGSFSKSPPTGARACVATLLGAVLVSGFLLSRYGNETVDRFTSEEVDAVSHLYRIAPTGSLLLAADNNLPWKYKHYGSYDYKTLNEYNVTFSNEGALERSVMAIMERRGGPDAFFIVTKGQKEAVKLLGVPAPTREARLGFSSHRRWLVDLEHTLRESPKFQTVFINPDAAIFVIAG